MNTPVAFLIYNRPDLTRRVFEAIAAARPARLLVVADGPRDDADREKCLAARAVLEGVDWPCDVQTCFSDANMGCRRRVASGLDWVFTQVEEAVILEDDCLPHPDFFRFCSDLLDYYRDEPRVMHIGGTDYNQGPPRGEASYYFSRYTSIWGWATWRRAWRAYDVDMSRWPEMRRTAGHMSLFGSKAEARHIAGVWDDIHSGVLDTWDGQWLFCCRQAGGLAISPNGNLISNIGFRSDATHTLGDAHPFAALPLGQVAFPLKHAVPLVPDTEADVARARAEFIRDVSVCRRVWPRLSNKHYYGALLRRVPVIGPWWAARRNGIS